MLTLFPKKITFFGDFHALKHVFFKFGMYLMCVSSMGQKFEKMTIFDGGVPMFRGSYVPSFSEKARNIGP